MPKYIYRDGTTHDEPSNLDVCGVRHDTRRLSEEEIIDIVAAHFARQIGSDTPIDVYLTGRWYGELGAMVEFGEDPNPIPF